MEAKFKDVAHYYLNTGLKIFDKANPSCTIELDKFYNHILPEEFWGKFGKIGLDQLRTDDMLVPYLRPMSDLTKPLEDGSTFMDKYFIEFGGGISLAGQKEWIESEMNNLSYSAYNALSLGQAQLLIKHHFNVFNISESQYIKKQ